MYTSNRVLIAIIILCMCTIQAWPALKATAARIDDVPGGVDLLPRIVQVHIAHQYYYILYITLHIVYYTITTYSSGTLHTTAYYYTLHIVYCIITSLRSTLVLLLCFTHCIYCIVSLQACVERNLEVM
jgi:hypothetical protein